MGRRLSWEFKSTYFIGRRKIYGSGRKERKVLLLITAFYFDQDHKLRKKLKKYHNYQKEYKAKSASQQ